MNAIRVIKQVAPCPPVFDVPEELDANIIRYQGQDYCLTDGRDFGSFIRWQSEPVASDYCPQVERFDVN